MRSARGAAGEEKFSGAVAEGAGGACVTVTVCAVCGCVWMCVRGNLSANTPADTPAAAHPRGRAPLAAAAAQPRAHPPGLGHARTARPPALPSSPGLCRPALPCPALPSPSPLHAGCPCLLHPGRPAASRPPPSSPSRTPGASKYLPVHGRFPAIAAEAVIRWIRLLRLSQPLGAGGLAIVLRTLPNYTDFYIFFCPFPGSGSGEGGLEIPIRNPASSVPSHLHVNPTIRQAMEMIKRYFSPSAGR